MTITQEESTPTASLLLCLHPIGALYATMVRGNALCSPAFLCMSQVKQRAAAS